MVAAMLLAMPGCKRAAREVVVYTSVDQPFSEPIFREFEKRSGMKVLAVFDTEETKSTGVVNRLIAEAQQPQADVFWPRDPVRPFLLVKGGIVQPYESPAAAAVPAQFKAADGSWTGSAARARILLVNKQKVPPAEMPKSIRDLVAPRWKRQTAIANPLFGTTTMHVAALFALWGEDKGLAFLDELKTNETRIASSNGEVKRLVVAGEVAFGLCDTAAVESDPADRVADRVACHCAGRPARFCALAVRTRGPDVSPGPFLSRRSVRTPGRRQVCARRSRSSCVAAVDCRCGAARCGASDWRPAVLRRARVAER